MCYEQKQHGKSRLWAFTLGFLIVLCLLNGGIVMADGNIQVSDFTNGVKLNTTFTSSPVQLYLDNPINVHPENFEFYMPMSENRSNTEELIFNNNGTVPGQVNYTTAGRYGGAFHFGGLGNFKITGTNSQLNASNGFTFSAWFYPDAGLANQYKRVYCQPTVFEIVTQNSANVSYVQVWNSSNVSITKSGTAASKFPEGQWVHFAAVYNTTHLATYINGKPDGTRTLLTPMTIAMNGSAYAVGARVDSSTAWNGTIDEVRIWNTSLLPTEIQAVAMSNYSQYGWYLYNISLNGSQPVNFTCNATIATNTTAMAYISSDTRSNSTNCSCPVYHCPINMIANTSMLYVNITLATNTTQLATPIITAFDIDYTNATTGTQSETPMNYPIITWTFDQGRLGSYGCTNSSCNLTLDEDVGATGTNQEYLWAYFDINGVYKNNITFNITNINASITSLFWNTSGVQLVYSCNKTNDSGWHRIVSPTWTSPYYTFTVNFTCNNASIATYYPYEYWRNQQLLTDVNSSSYVHQTTLATTYGGRSVSLLEISNFAIANTSKKTIYAISGQHPAETYGMWSADGLIRWLIGTNASAELIRNTSIVYVIPMINPDGTYNGTSRTNRGIDYNRQWNNSNVLEIANVTQHIIGINNSLGLDIFFDLHGDNGGSTIDYITPWPESAAPYANYYVNLVNFYYNLTNYSSVHSKTESVVVGSAGWYNANSTTNYKNGLSFAIEGRMSRITWNQTTAQQEGAGYLMAVARYFNLTYSPLTADTTSPTWSGLTNNGTDPHFNDSIFWQVSLHDETALDSVSFNTNASVFSASCGNTGSVTDWIVNCIVRLNNTAGDYVCGNFTFNDTSGNINYTSDSCFTINAIPVVILNYSNSTLGICTNPESNLDMPCLIPFTYNESCSALNLSQYNTSGYMKPLGAGDYIAPYNCAVLFNETTSGDYFVNASNGFLTSLKLVEDKTMFSMLIALPLVIAGILVFGAAKLEGPQYEILKVMMYLVCLLMFVFSIHTALLTIGRYYDFPEMSEHLAYFSGVLNWVIFVIIGYFGVITISKAVHDSMERKKAKFGGDKFGTG